MRRGKAFDLAVYQLSELVRKGSHLGCRKLRGERERKRNLLSG